MAFIAFCFFSLFLLISSTMVIVARNPVHSVLYLILGFFNGSALFLLLGAEFLAMLLVIVYVGAVAVLFLFVVMMLEIKERPRGSFFSTLKMRQAFKALCECIIYLIPFSFIFGGGGFLIYYFKWITPLHTDIQWQLCLAVILFFVARFGAVSLTGINLFDVTRRFFRVIPLSFLLGFVIMGELVILIVSTHLSNDIHVFKENLILSGNILNTERLGIILYTQYIIPFIIAGFILLVAMVGAIILTLRTREDGRRQKISAQVARNKDNSITMVDVPIGQGLEIERDKP